MPPMRVLQHNPSCALTRPPCRLQALNTLPFVMTMANCVCWTSYAFLIEDWYLVIANSLGFLIGLFLFLTAFGIGVPDVRARDRVHAVCVTDAVVLLTVAILERMVITTQSAKEQLWGYTGATPPVCRPTPPDSGDTAATRSFIQVVDISQHLVNKIYQALQAGLPLFVQTHQVTKTHMRTQLMLCCAEPPHMRTRPVLCCRPPREVPRPRSTHQPAARCFSCALRVMHGAAAANVMLVFFFLSPLSTLLTVVRRRDSASLVLPLCVMNILNGALWSTYGLVRGDPFIWAPNVFGAVLGVLQTTLRLSFPQRAPDDPTTLCVPPNPAAAYSSRAVLATAAPHVTRRSLGGALSTASSRAPVTREP